MIKRILVLILFSLVSLKSLTSLCPSMTQPKLTRGPEGPEGSPYLLNNVKKGQGKNRLIIQACFILPYMGMVAISPSGPK